MLKISVLPLVSSHSIPYSASLFLMAGALLINFAVSIQTPPWDPPLPERLAGHIVLSQPALGTCLRAVLSRSPCKWLYSSEFPASILTGRRLRQYHCPRGPGRGADGHVGSAAMAAVRGTAARLRIWLGESLHGRCALC